MKAVFTLFLLILLAGCAGPKGEQGTQGSAGAQGIAGQNGLDGAPGTQIDVVQFCPNSTPTYPSTFPEYGLCIEGKLYGVYSANGGFLAELPDGTYSSNAVGSACTFTIRGCDVQ